jgi:hypothetical protein
VNKKQKESFERWWKREVNSGLALTDDFEVGVIRAMSEAAYKAGIRVAKKPATVVSRKGRRQAGIEANHTNRF